MQVEKFVEILGAEFYAGVPDSQLRALCDYLIQRYGVSENHIIAANEGNCTALAAGYYLATGKVPVVYMQNSGIGNVINPVASLLNEQVYGIPCIFVVGWRGEPGVHDEPQHIYQGEITLKLLEDMDIKVAVLSKNTTEIELEKVMEGFYDILSQGKSVAFLVRKNALQYEKKVKYQNSFAVNREEVIRHIVDAAGESPIISTTGKASRELFEIREANGQGHQHDFLTVGSMGHASSIALGIATRQTGRKIWCVDGDGSALMHMGAMAILGSRKQRNIVHIVINNEAHETVGGMPTVASQINFSMIARGCGYPNVYSVSTLEELDAVLEEVKNVMELSFIEVTCMLGSRSDLGRPTTTTRENKEDFMAFLQKEKRFSNILYTQAGKSCRKDS